MKEKIKMVMMTASGVVLLQKCVANDDNQSLSQTYVVQVAT